MATLCCPKQAQGVYRPRRPEQTPLFQLIKKHYTTWHKDRDKNSEVPHYISKTFQKYLGCGILSKGFACAHCDGCNKNFFIAFSCKARGLCPSCNQRSMVETAAHLIDELLPRLPFRQFVISFATNTLLVHYGEKNQYIRSYIINKEYHVAVASNTQITDINPQSFSL